jgi:hypothetical protein
MKNYIEHMLIIFSMSNRKIYRRFFIIMYDNQVCHYTHICNVVVNFCTQFCAIKFKLSSKNIILAYFFAYECSLQIVPLSRVYTVLFKKGCSSSRRSFFFLTRRQKQTRLEICVYKKMIL